MGEMPISYKNSGKLEKIKSSSKYKYCLMITWHRWSCDRAVVKHFKLEHKDMNHLQ